MNDARARRFPLVGLLVGLVALAGLVGAMLALDAAAPAHSSGSSAEIVLPDEVGGLTAVDLPDQPQASEAKAAFDYNDEGFSEALGGAAARSRVYVSEDQEQAIRIVALRIDAGPLLPYGFTDPAASQFGEAEVHEQHGEADCLVTRVPETDETGQPVQGGATEIGGAVCRRTADDLTVTLEMRGLELDQTVGLLDEIFTDLHA